jgi:DNA-binding MarR family transcriptional regulator
MSIKAEMKIKHDFGSTGEEAMLNVIYTAERWKKLSTTIYGHFGITPAQFNVLHLVYYQSDKDVGLTQAEISEMMLVKPANTTPLVDRLEALELVERTAVPEDRRFWRVKLLPKGISTFKQANKVYYDRIRAVYEQLSEEELQTLISALEKVRDLTTNFEPDFGGLESKKA